MMVKSGLDFLFWNSPSPFWVAAAQCKNICPEWPNWPSSLAGIWRGSVNFKINSRQFFKIIFKLKNYNFKTRDFSPLIERVLAGVKKTNFSAHCTFIKKWLIFTKLLKLVNYEIVNVILGQNFCQNVYGQSWALMY